MKNEIDIIYFQKMEVNVGKRSWYTYTNIIPETRGQYIAILFFTNTYKWDITCQKERYIVVTKTNTKIFIVAVIHKCDRIIKNNRKTI